MLKLIVWGVALVLAFCFIKRETYKSWFNFWEILFSFVITAVLFDAALSQCDDVLPYPVQPCKYAILALVVPVFFLILQKLMVKFLSPINELGRSVKGWDYLFSLILNYGAFFLLVNWLLIVIVLTPYREKVLGEKLGGEAANRLFELKEAFGEGAVAVFFREPVTIEMRLPDPIDKKPVAPAAAAKPVKQTGRKTPGNGKAGRR